MPFRPVLGWAYSVSPDPRLLRHRGSGVSPFDSIFGGTTEIMKEIIGRGLGL
jgi:hypothetical protein